MKPRTIAIGILVGIVFLTVAYAVRAAVPWKAIVTWDRNPEPDLAGYKVRVYPVPATGTGWVYETGDITNIITVPGPGRYSVTVSARASNGLESLESVPIFVEFDSDGFLVQPSQVVGVRLLLETTITATVTNWITVK